MNSRQGGSFACCCALAAETAALFGDLHDRVCLEFNMWNASDWLDSSLMYAYRVGLSWRAGRAPLAGLLGDCICAGFISDLPWFSCWSRSLMLSAGTAGCRVMTAEALRAAVVAGPALAALLGLVFLSSLEGDTASAVAGRAAACGLLGPAGRPYERRERAALAGL